MLSRGGDGLVSTTCSQPAGPYASWFPNVFGSVRPSDHASPAAPAVAGTAATGGATSDTEGTRGRDVGGGDSEA